jgi:hypothetical protein
VINDLHAERLQFPARALTGSWVSAAEQRRLATETARISRKMLPFAVKLTTLSIPVYIIRQKYNFEHFQVRPVVPVRVRKKNTIT